MTGSPQIREGQVLLGTLFSEPMRVEVVRANGADTWSVGLVGTQTERFRNVTLTSRDIAKLTILDATFTFDGDGKLLCLGLQAYSLGIAYEFDPYFGLSISRVDPLPHQLEAVYDYLLKLARIRFLLADDAGAGKTIMAGILIRELKLRGQPDGKWIARKIFTKRIPHTVDFQIDGAEFDLYRNVSRFVKDQSAQAAVQGDDPRAEVHNDAGAGGYSTVATTETQRAQRWS